MDNIEQGFYLFNVVPRVLRKHWREFFLCNVVWSLMDNIAQGFYLYRVIPRVLPKITLNKCFSVQCCLEALGQHYTWFLPIQCCPKSIKTTLNMIFSCAVLSGTSWISHTQCCPNMSETTLCKKITGAMLAQTT